MNKRDEFRRELKLQRKMSSKEARRKYGIDSVSDAMKDAFVERFECNGDIWFEIPIRSYQVDFGPISKISEHTAGR